MADAAAGACNARCPRCGAGFHCGAQDARCDCAQLALSEATLARLRADYGACCLCIACLKLVQAPPEPIRAPQPGRGLA